jgi:hypothetical protein
LAVAVEELNLAEVADGKAVQNSPVLVVVEGSVVARKHGLGLFVVAWRGPDRRDVGSERHR